MKKVAYSVTEQQIAWLHKEATRLGVSVSELLRRILDKARGE